jgi:N-acyl-D-amino-acid deacylase
VDLIIEGGLVYDGTGAPPRIADVGISADRIVEVGPLDGVGAAERIAAHDALVTPGFIDIHSHSDLTLLANPGFESTVRQGVTTELVGNCGLSLAPLLPSGRAAVTRQLRDYGYEGDVGWGSFGEYVAQVEHEGVAVNLAWLVGHSAIRAAAGASGAEASEAEVAAMRTLLDGALDDGAWGISTGLEYDPGRLASENEITRVAEVAGRRGGFYASHIRNRDARLIEAVDEAISIARESGSGGQISHLNVRRNTGAVPDAWDRAVERIERARAQGVDVMADATPFTFGLGLMVNLLPAWATDGGPAATAGRLADPVLRARIRGDLDRYWRFLDRGDWGRAGPVNSREFPAWNGLTFEQIGADSGREPGDACLEIIAAAGSDMDAIFMMGDLFDEPDLIKMIRHPLFLLGADTMSSRTDGLMGSLMGHNAISFAGHVHFLLRYGLDLKVLPLEALIRKMTAMPAERFGFVDRGVLRAGALADVVVLRPERLVERISPAGYASGVDEVVVNGVRVVAAGATTGARPGRTLRPN